MLVNLTFPQLQVSLCTYIGQWHFDRDNPRAFNAVTCSLFFPLLARVYQVRKKQPMSESIACSCILLPALARKGSWVHNVTTFPAPRPTQCPARTRSNLVAWGSYIDDPKIYSPPIPRHA
ncbi:uncharacterized protein BDW70DRAFT_35901 [Aspergillus foveolatus]|uniref:uncharacterized protein n=1 Tax=Aspergillus foveolatus TaxID=210207 RepID=UPI003CCDB44E